MTEAEIMIIRLLRANLLLELDDKGYEIPKEEKPRWWGNVRATLKASRTFLDKIENEE